MANPKKIAADMTELRVLEVALQAVTATPESRLTPVIDWTVTRNTHANKKAAKAAIKAIRATLPAEEFKLAVIAGLQAEIDKIKNKYPGMVD